MPIVNYKIKSGNLNYVDFLSIFGIKCMHRIHLHVGRSTSTSRIFLVCRSL